MTGVVVDHGSSLHPRVGSEPPVRPRIFVIVTTNSTVYRTAPTPGCTAHLRYRIPPVNKICDIQTLVRQLVAQLKRETACHCRCRADDDFNTLILIVLELSDQSCHDAFGVTDFTHMFLGLYNGCRSISMESKRPDKEVGLPNEQQFAKSRLLTNMENPDSIVHKVSSAVTIGGKGSRLSLKPH